MNKLFIGLLVLAVAALGIAVTTTATEFSTANIGGHVVNVRQIEVGLSPG